MNDLHKYIDSWSGKQLFLYVVIFIIIIWLFLGQNVGMNILIAIIIGAFVISYLNYRTIEKADTYEELQNDKLSMIKPPLNNICPKQEAPIVDFLFSIQ